MFINIDYNKRPQKAKLELARPNMRIIDNLSEKFRDSVGLKLGDINELSFSIPHFIDGEYNKHVDTVKEKMLIKLSLGSYKEWYIIDSIEEDGDDADIFNVKAFSLGYELKGKRIKSLNEESLNLRELLLILTENTVWSIGEIDPMFEAMYRSFDINDSNVLDAIIQACETFGALIQWNTTNRTVSFINIKDNGRFRGMTVDYGRFLRSIKRTRTTDEMVTRMYVYGAEDISIQSVNPTGQNYIEDFSYFMYPFERDPITKETITSSKYFMTDELCHAILDHQETVSVNAPQIKTYQDEKADKDFQLITEESTLEQLKLELDNILALLDIAQSTEDNVVIEQRKNERDAKQSEIQSQQIVVDNLISEISNLNTQIENLQNQISKENNFTPELLRELNLYIIESEWRDDKYNNASDLYNDGLKKFEELRQPKVVIDVTIDNLLNIIEEQYYWDKLVLGDLIKVKYPQMKIEYMAKIIEINYDLENGEASIKIANTTDLLNDTEKLVQLLYSNSNATSLIENNKYKWNKIYAVEKEVNAIITQEWDANKNKIIAGVNNTIEVGNRGIIIKNPDFPNEVVIMQSGIIALSKDGGETWKTAIKPDGIVAERLIGQIIAGQELIITNSAGTFTMDNNGAIFDVGYFQINSSSGDNLVDRWQNSSDFVDNFVDDNIITPYEKKKLNDEWNKFKSKYDSNVIRLNGFYEDQGNSIPEVTQYHQYYQDLYSYLFIDNQTDGYALLDPNNNTKATRIDRVIFESKFNNYRNQELKVEELLMLRAKTLAENAQAVADEAMGDIAELEDDIVWKIELYSSKGFTFKNGIIDTVITATIYRGKDDVTATVPLSGFIWKKFDKNGVLDQQWTDAHVGVGNVISITSQDVKERAIFSCDVDIV